MLEFQLTDRMWPFAHAVVRNEGTLVALCDIVLLPPWEKEDFFSLRWDFYFDQTKTALYAELYENRGDYDDDIGFLTIHWASAEVAAEAYPSFKLLFTNAKWEN